jgi:predicted RND superfamily exporter protein
VVRFFRRKKEKTQNESATTDYRQEASSKAEDEKKAHAHQSISDETKTETASKLLVVGRESVFSEEIIDYAIEMAERLSYGIIALNTAPLPCDTFRLFSSSRKQICEDFEKISKKNSIPFQERAEKKGILFSHVVKFSDSYEVLKEIKAEIGEFEFVVSEMEEDPEDASTAENGEKAKREISVYSIM